MADKKPEYGWQKIPNVELFLGKKSGDRIEDKIKGAKKSIKIISPFLGPVPINWLIEKHNSGIDVKVISNDKNIFYKPKDSVVLKELIKQEISYIADKDKSRSLIKELILRLFVCAAAYFALLYVLKLDIAVLNVINKDVLVYAVISNIIIILCLTRKYKSKYARGREYSYNTTIPIKFVNYVNDKNKNPDYNVYFHSKLYIIDDETAYVGSLNFTYYGFNSNVETCLEITDKNSVLKLSKFFDSKYNDKYIETRDISYYGRQIYGEL
ncbi:MAG: phospholipase D family protein [Spirochaetaceae bacterium]|jgi:phosphatidylserine/phosphatidylglycerophosphate/cardiolipin synthase-like enzyme|nr:phospholipase D family protein [Spirochaetaceae bacterium]